MELLITMFINRAVTSPLFSEQHSTKTRMKNLTRPCLRFLCTTMGVSHCPISPSRRILPTCIPIRAKFLLPTLKKRLGFFSSFQPYLYICSSCCLIFSIPASKYVLFVHRLAFVEQVLHQNRAPSSVAAEHSLCFRHVLTRLSQIAGLYTSSPALGRYFSEASIDAFR